VTFSIACHGARVDRVDGEAGAGQRDHEQVLVGLDRDRRLLGALLFGQVLAVCARAGVLRPGLVAIDGTKRTANASPDANRTAEELAEQILTEAEAADAAEDAARTVARTGRLAARSGLVRAAAAGYAGC
jgi:hypothetical protein